GARRRTTRGPSRHRRRLSSTLPDSSHCLRLRPDASGKSFRSVAVRVAASLTSEHGERALAEQAKGAQEAYAESESGGGNHAPDKRSQRAAPAHVEGPVQHAPGERGGEHR